MDPSQTADPSAVSRARASEESGGALLWGILPRDAELRRQALLAFTLFSLLMMTYYIFKPMRGALFLHYAGARNLPYVYLASPFVAGGVMALYNHLLRHVSAGRLLEFTVAAQAVIAACFWVADAAGVGTAAWRAVAIFLWVSVYAALAPTLFWSLSDDVFSVQSSVRFYGLVGAGGSVGALIGAKITDVSIRSHWVVTEQLLLVGAGVLLFSLPVMRMLRATGETRAVETPQPGAEAPSEAGDFERGGLWWIMRDGYVAKIALLVGLTWFIGTLLDFEYNHVVDALFPGKDQKTAFFSDLYWWVNIVSISVQLLVTGRVHRRFGPMPGLIVLPVLGFVALFTLLGQRSIHTVSVLWVLGLALTYSIYQASKELLYVPTPRAVKYGAKGYIDVFVFRLSDALASLLVLFLVHALDLSFAYIAPVIAFCLFAWMAVIIQLGRSYRERVERRQTPSETAR